jgi:hypothetical protein
VTSTTPADTLAQHLAALDWAAQLLAQQPDDLQQAYHGAARQIAEALTHVTYTLTVQLPNCVYLNGTLTLVPRKWVVLHAGSWLHRWRRQVCHADLIAKLNALVTLSHVVIASSARLVAYLSARELLYDYVPTPDDLQSGSAVAIPQVRLNTSEDRVKAEVDRLCSYVEALRWVEQLYPGWTADDLYSEKYARLTARLTRQGHALAVYYTQRIIDDLLGRWHSGEVIRGLTLLVPYLDEQHYQMKTYRVEVIPTGRIAFRPEFVVGACRVTEQEVRHNPQLSQATRWQLISQLDMLSQAFETIPSKGSSHSA